MKSRLVIASNRLPVQLEEINGQVKVQRSSGGLITALQRVAAQHTGVWVGWPGCEDNDSTRSAFEKAEWMPGFQFEPVFLTAAERKHFYCGFSNEIVWPLFHDLQSRCNFDPTYWETYQRVNQKFADHIGFVAASNDLIWVHDYHLLEVARYLRREFSRSRIVFFQHIPFPPTDIFEKLPWRSEILSALLQYDMIGFQTARDRRNFLSCLRHLKGKIPVINKGQSVTIEYEGRPIDVGHYPIGIDFPEFANGAADPEVERRAIEIQESLGGSRIVLGVDRLDYTKGIPERLRAFGLFLRRHPELHRRVTLLQVTVPSRENIPKYQELRLEIESLVSTINGEFTHPGWVPIHYIHRSLERQELLAYYRAAEVAMVTPLKDGMNLVCKEFCACQLNNDGVLILSEFAGAAPEAKKGALLVNPYHLTEVADALHDALHMSEDERTARMRQLRRQFRKHDVYRWSRHFVRDARPVPLAMMREPDVEDRALTAQAG